MTEPAWRISSYCEGGSCIEVAEASAAVLVRDAKDHDAGTLQIRRAAWSAFLAAATRR